MAPSGVGGQPWARSTAALGTRSPARCPCRGARAGPAAGRIPSATLFGQAEFAERCLPLCFQSRALCREAVTGARGAFSCPGAGKDLYVPPALNTFAQGGQGVRRGSPSQTHQGISFVGGLGPPWAQTPRAWCGDKGLCWPLAFCCMGLVDGVAFAGMGVQESCPVTQLSPARQGWSRGQLSLHLWGKLLMEGDQWICVARDLRVPEARFARPEQARLGVVYDHLLPFKLLWANRRTA